MRSRAARLTLVVLFVAALGVTAYLFWMGESLARREAAAGRTFDDSAHAVTRTLLDIRAAQQAYVAAGQGGEFWSTQVSAGLSKARQAVAALRDAATAAEAQKGLDGVAAGLKEFDQLDRRITNHTRGGNQLAAADLIFADSRQLLETAVASLERARVVELAAREEAGALFERRQAFALAAAAAASILAILLLASGHEPGAAAVPLSPASPARADGPAAPELSRLALDEGWNAPRRSAAPPEPAAAGTRPPEPAGAAIAKADPPTAERNGAQTAQAPAAVVPLHVVTSRTAEADAPSTDFPGLARLCGDLACLTDTRALPDLLERAASLLDASGIILWIADPDGRELNPIFAQGYPPQLVSRLGTIPRDAENATAAAFRTSLVQTVHAASASEGAIAAPLVTPSGCIGVMAAEVRNAREKRDDTLAAAAIVAAQLAALVGPPGARQPAVSTR
jgi:hypothetical protein